MHKFSPEQLLPHRAPMLLVDHIIQVSEDYTSVLVEAVCSTKDLLYDASLQGVSPMASIEIMAQAIGLLSGYSDRMQGIPPASMGKLLSIKQYQIHTKALPVEVPLQVSAKAVLQMPPLGVYACSIQAQGELLAEAEITVYREDQ